MMTPSDTTSLGDVSHMILFSLWCVGREEEERCVICGGKEQEERCVICGGREQGGTSGRREGEGCEDEDHMLTVLMTSKIRS